MNKFLWLILAMALMLRLWGIDYGFPNFLINDERALVFGALKMIELKTLVPAWHPEEFRPLYYMPFMSYVFLIWLLPFLAVKYALAGFPAVGEFKTALLVDPSSIWIWSRALVAILGTLNVFVVYLISKKIFNSERAAILTAAFLAVSFFHVQLSHMTRHWLPATAFVYLAWLLILRIRESDELKNYIWGALATSAAFITNPSAIAVLIPLGIFHFEKRKFLSKNIFIFPVLFAICSSLFIALHPFGITFAEPTKGGLDPAGSVLWRLTHAFSFGISGLAANLNLYAITLLKYDIFLFIFGLPGFCLAYFLKRDRIMLYAASLFVAGYITIVYMMLITFSRPVIMLLPIFAVYAGFALDWLISRFSRWRIDGWLALAIIFSWPLALGIQYDYLLSKHDSRIVATDWIKKNIPADAKILAYLPYTRLPNSKEGILAMQKIDAASLRSADIALLSLPDEKYPESSFNVLNLHFISRDSPYRTVKDIEFFKRQGFEYLVIEYADENMADLDEQVAALIGKGPKVENGPQAKLLTRLIGTYDLRDEISGTWPWKIFKYKQFGPNIDVYEL